jgi:hypothetical protein
MKKLLLIFAIVFIVQIEYAQTDSLYLGQTPPETTPILFADDLMLGGTALQCARIAISSDGKEIYFTRRNSLGIDEEDIQYFKYENSKWNGPFVLFPGFSAMYLAPTFSVDGNILYFQTYNGSISVSYYCERDSDEWKTPQLFRGYSGELHYLQETNNNNFYAAVKNGINGLGNYDICKITFSNDTISEIRSLGVPLNTNSNEGIFFIAKDESFIIVGRNENFSIGNRDLYISYKKSDGAWSNPKSLGSKINNGSTLKWGPYVTSDSKYLFYESDAIRWTTWWVRFDGLLDSLRYTNFPPYLKNSIPDQTVIKDSLFYYHVPDSTFFDDDGNNTLTYSAALSDGNALPIWLSFDSTATVFSGSPNSTGIINIKVTAKDAAKASASCTFRITVIVPAAIEKNNDQLTKKFILDQTTLIHLILALK